MARHLSTARRGQAVRRGRLPRLTSAVVRGVAGLLSVALISAALAAGSVTSAGTATAAAGNPGTPSAPTTVFTENFQNVPGATPIQRLTSYTGASGQKYTANRAWLTLCNGWVASANQSTTASAQITDCTSAGSSSSAGQSAWNQSQQLAQALGIASGQTTAAARGNYANTDFTSGNPGAGLVEFQTTSNVPFTASNRFLSFSADVAAVNCGVSAPLLQFQLLNDAGTPTNAGSQVNACTSGKTVAVPALGTATAKNVNVATATSNGAVLFSGTSVGIRMLNNNGSGAGNDHTIDNVKILDVTPQLDKAFSPTSVKTGETSTLTFTITNTSELGTKNGWSFTDGLPSGLTVANPNAAATTCTAGTVTAAVGGGSVAVKGNLNQGQTSCTVSVQVTARAAGTYTNGPGNVTASGLNAPGTAAVQFSAPSLGIVKHAGAPTDVNRNGLTDAGDTIPYTFTVTNTGDVPLTDVRVTDAKVGAVTCPDTTLAVGSDETCEAAADYTITTADVQAGSVDNTATASGTAPTGATVTSTPSTTSTPVTAPAPALSLVKSADPAGPGSYETGQEITYSFTVANTGNVPMNDITIHEGDFSGTGTISDPTCPSASLTVGAQEVCTATYTLTQADVDAGTITNTATAAGTPPGSSTPVSSTPSTATVTVEQSPTITVVKSADVQTITGAGQQVKYSFLVTNTGNVTLHDLTVDDSEFSGDGDLPDVSCPASTLQVGSHLTCTATYTTRQSDVDEGGNLTNTATAAGTPPDSNTSTSSEPSTVRIPVDQTPRLSLVKTAEPSSEAKYQVGQTITYSFTMTNTGNTTLTDSHPEEGDFTGAGTLTEPVCPDAAESMAPGAAVTCKAMYTVTQEDVDAGELTNTATATATSPDGAPVRSDPATVTVPADQSPALTVEKTADPGTVSTAGQEVTYSFVVTNTGTVTLRDVTVTDQDFSGTGDLSEIDCPATTLPPGRTTTCTARYTVTQADVDTGTITNTATVTGTPPGADTPVSSDPSTATVTVDRSPSLTVEKTADPGRVSTEGQEITYSFVVTNTGNVSLHDVTVTDHDFTGTGRLSEVSCPSGPLAVRADRTCTATYTTTRADIDAGTISNTATAVGTPSGVDTPVSSDPSTATVAVDQRPAITVVKTADRETITKAGEDVTYSFLVTNTGNVTLSDLTVTDSDFSGTGRLSAIDCPSSTLTFGADEICTATYTTTQADVDAGGSLTNTATAEGTPPSSDTPTTSGPSTVEIPVDRQPAVTVVKHAGTPVDVNGNGLTDAGDTIAYTFTVTNTGNTTLTDVGVTDAKAGAVSCPEATLAVGSDPETCTADSVYTITAADVANGSVDNTATADGTIPGSDAPTPSAPSTTTTPTTEPDPSLTVVKTVSASAGGSFTAGETLTYSFAVSNTGNVRLNDVAIDDREFSGTGELSGITCLSTALAVGAAETCTATYTVTQADVDAGGITNTATANGTPPGGDPVPSDPSTVTVPSTSHPALALVKTSDVATITTVGQAVTYSFEITNTGGVTQEDVHPAEGAFNGSGTLPEPTCPAAAASLAPGASVTCTAVYHVTKADLSTGRLSNTATAVGTDPNGDPTGSVPSTAKVAAVAPVVLAVPGSIPAIPGLAFTGFDGFWPLTISAALLLLGALLVVVARIRRRRAKSSTRG